MSIIVINVDSFQNEKVLSKIDNGKKLRNSLNLNEIEKESQDSVILIFPKDLYVLTTSYVRGLFETFIMENDIYSYDIFEKKYKCIFNNVENQRHFKENIRHLVREKIFFKY